MRSYLLLCKRCDYTGGYFLSKWEVTQAHQSKLIFGYKSELCMFKA